MKNHLLYSALVASGLLFGAQSAVAAPDWSKVPVSKIHTFHPGVTPMEWVQGKGQHGGSRGMVRGETCAGCHVEEGEINLDLARIAKELEPKGAPATMSFPVSVQAAYDAEHLYLRLSFKAPAGGFDKSDKDNEVKATVLFPSTEVPIAEIGGCWATCHQDMKSMPEGQDKTKHVKAGKYDLMQWASSGKQSDGVVDSERRMSGGQAALKAEGSKAGDVWTVTFKRKLAGGVKLEAGKALNFGIAIHADHASARFHHVSFGHTIGLGAAGDVKALKF